MSQAGAEMSFNEFNEVQQGSAVISQSPARFNPSSLSHMCFKEDIFYSHVCCALKAVARLVQTPKSWWNHRVEGIKNKLRAGLSLLCSPGKAGDVPKTLGRVWKHPGGDEHQ